jgi:hypothetical protein
MSTSSWVRPARAGPATRARVRRRPGSLRRVALGIRIRPSHQPPTAQRAVGRSHPIMAKVAACGTGGASTPWLSLRGNVRRAPPHDDTICVGFLARLASWRSSRCRRGGPSAPAGDRATGVPTSSPAIQPAAQSDSTAAIEPPATTPAALARDLRAHPPATTRRHPRRARPARPVARRPPPPRRPPAPPPTPTATSRHRQQPRPRPSEPPTTCLPNRRTNASAEGQRRHTSETLKWYPRVVPTGREALLARPESTRKAPH